MDPIAQTAKALVPLTDLFKNLGKTIKDTLGPALTGITSAFKSFGATLAGLAESWLKPLTQKLGEMFSKIPGMVSGWLAPLENSLGKVFGAIGDKLEPVLKPITQRLGKVFGGISEVLGSAGAAAGKVVGGLGSALGGLAKGAGAAVGGAIAIGEAIGGMVAKANPALFQRFTLAMNDLQAVLGRALAPVFEIIIDIIRTAADTLTTFADSIGGAIASVMRPLVEILKVQFDMWGRIGQVIGKLAETAAPAIASLGKVLVAVFQAIQPIVNLLIDLVGGALGAAFEALAGVIQTVMPYITAFIQLIGEGLKQVTQWIRQLLAFIGIELKEGGPGVKPGASVGAAVTSVGHTGMDEFIKKAQASAFAIGSGGGKKPEERTAGAAEIIKTEIEKIRTFIEKIPGEIANLPAKLALAIGNKFVDAAKALVKALDPFSGPSFSGGDAVNAGGGAAAGFGRTPPRTMSSVADAMDRAAEARARHGDAGGTVGSFGGGGDF